MIYSKHSWTTYELNDPIWKSQEITKSLDFQCDEHPQKTGLLLVGLCGNNASTLVASIYANKNHLSWKTRSGTQQSNYYGSVFMSSTTTIPTTTGNVHKGLNSIVPMIHPNDLIIDGWDIVDKSIYQSIQDNYVLEPDLIQQLSSLQQKPMPSVFYPDFYAENQQSRVNHCLSGTKFEHLTEIRKNIKDFKSKHQLDKVVVLWTASTERFSKIIQGINDTSQNLLEAIKNNHAEIAPSTIFAVASILEGAIFINGSPQNTLTDAVLELSKTHHAFVAGDDFKSGQTKLKSVLVEFLINAGIKPLAITSYNHLGNNDGLNLSQQAQFKSKEISKSNVVDDMVASNPILYKTKHIDHTVVIKYVPSVGDHKRAMDEYYSEIFMGGRSIISITNICEDSLLAAPLIIDLTLFAELLSRVKYKEEEHSEYSALSSCLGGMLSYMLKAPTVSNGPVINALNTQRRVIENFVRMLVNLKPVEDCPIEWIK